MPQTTTQNATRQTQTATHLGSPQTASTVAVWISDARARDRVITALREEGLVARLVTAKDFTVRGLQGATAGALIYDLAPWTDEAIKFLRRLRDKRRPMTNLSVLVYAPPGPEVGRLLVEAGSMEMVWGESQLAEVSDIARLRRTIRQMLAVTPASVVLQLLMVYAPHLPPLVVQFCQIACITLGAGKGDTLTVSFIASELGADRRTLERRWRIWSLPSPKDFLAWIIILFAAYLSERHRISVYDTNELLGMSVERLRRCRLRLRPRPLFEKGVEPVLTALTRRIAQFVPWRTLRRNWPPTASRTAT